MQLELFPKMVEIVPNWSPLEILCKKYSNGRFSAHGRNGKLEITDFMWMHSWDDIQCYKHRMNRGYLNIDSDGKYYRYSPKDSEYHEVSKYEAFEALFG